MAHFQTQWAICSNRFDFWAEPWVSSFSTMFSNAVSVRVMNPFPNDKFKTSKLEEFADDNFKCDENARKLSKRIENTVGKGEIACSGIVPNLLWNYPKVFILELSQSSTISYKLLET